MKKSIMVLICAVALSGCITGEHITVIHGNGNTITVTADVPKDIKPNATVSVIP